MSLPRPRPSLAPCARCGATSFLRVAPVREHGHGGVPVPLAVAWVEERRAPSPFARAVSCVGPPVELSPRGRFHVLVCTACGDTRWYARDLHGECLAALPVATLGPCPDCGKSRSRRVSPVKIRGSSGRPSDFHVLRRPSRRWGFVTTACEGRFSLFVCQACGRARWLAEGLGAIASTPAPPCVRCAGTARIVVDPVDEDGAILRVVYDRAGPREIRAGRYRLSICAPCGLTDWTAMELDHLDVDSTWGLALLDASSAQEGPYR